MYPLYLAATFLDFDDCRSHPLIYRDCVLTMTCFRHINSEVRNSIIHIREWSTDELLGVYWFGSQALFNLMFVPGTKIRGKAA